MRDKLQQLVATSLERVILRILTKLLDESEIEVHVIIRPAKK